MLQRRADPDLRDRDGRTALYLAMFGEREDMALELVGRGAQPQLAVLGNTPLRWARLMNMPRVADALRQRDASE